MENLNDFYVVLPSNSSMNYYPENATSCFTTRLSREIRLHGNWSVGLAEIHVPCTIMHIQDSEAFFALKIEKDSHELKTCFFPSGIYQSIDELANEINKSEGVAPHQVLEPSSSQKGFYILKRNCDCEQPHKTYFNEKMRRIFGFESIEQRHTGSFTTSKAHKTITAGSRPASLTRAIPDQMFIYTDICESQAVGDTQSSLLRIVSLDTSKYKFGSNAISHFSAIHYIPLMQHNIRDILIDIRDQYGKHISFEYGTLTVTLHFKRNH